MFDVFRTYPTFCSLFKTKPKTSHKHTKMETITNKQKTNKTGNSQTKWNKKLILISKNHWVCLVLVNMLDMGARPGVWLMCPVTPHRETNFFFVTGYRLQIASWLGLELCVHFPCSVMGLNLCSTCMYCHSLCAFICVSAQLCLEDTEITFASYNLSTFSSILIPEL